MLTVLPIIPASNKLIEDPNLAMPTNERALPRRMKLRRDSVVPMCMKSNADTLEPNIEDIPAK